MADRLDAKPDHVAVAVPDRAAAAARWVDDLGGAWLIPTEGYDNGVFRARQLRYANGAKLELVEPSPKDDSPESFLRRYLTKFGAGIHHITLKVPDVLPAVAFMRDHGYDVVDVFTDDEWWQEGFLRPSQVGGVIVQIAHSKLTDDELATMRGTSLGTPRDDAPDLLGPVLQHPDLDAAQRLWRLLGADVQHMSTEGVDELACTWSDAPLQVFVREGDPAGPLHLRVRGGASRAADPDLGAEVRPV